MLPAAPIKFPPFVFPSIAAKLVWIAERRRDGQTLQEIADQLGCSRSRAHQLVRRMEAAKKPKRLSSADFRAKAAKPIELGDEYNVWFHYELGPGALV